MRLIRVLLIVALVLVFSLFVAQNTTTVNVNFLNYTLPMPLFFLVLVSAFFGFLIPALYMSIKISSKLRRINQIDRMLRYFYTGYFSKSADVAKSLARDWEPAGAVYVESQTLKGDLSLEVGDFNKDSGLLEGYVGSHLLRHKDLAQAKEYLKKALSKDEDNLTALKAYRDSCYMESNIKECVEYQEKVLQKCERWEKEKQKAILAELLCILSENVDDLKEKENLLNRAFDLQKTPMVYAYYIANLLDRDDVREARKQMDRAFKEGLQNQVLSILMDKEKALTKMVDFVEQRKDQIQPETLARIYMRLNMVGRLREIEPSLKGSIKVIAQMHASYTQEGKQCKDALLELYKPWKCKKCEKLYNSYKPYCEYCNEWMEVDLRREQDVDRH